MGLEGPVKAHWTSRTAHLQTEGWGHAEDGVGPQMLGPLLAAQIRKEGL